MPEVLRPCFMPQPFLGFLPSESSPHRRSLTPLEAAWLPCSYPPVCGDARPETFQRRFRRRPRSRAVAWFPRCLWVPFPHAGARFPVALGLVLRNRPVPPASPASKLHSLLRVRSQPGRVSPHQLADTLLGFCPSGAFSSHASGSRPVQAREPEHVPSTRGRRDRDSGDRSPLCQVRPFQYHEVHRNNLVDGFQPPYEAGPHRLSTATPSPLTLRPRAHPLPVVFGASKYVERGVSPQRSPSPLGFVTSSATS
jgi:hypothetical protein